jgi:hypothetical protein
MSADPAGNQGDCSWAELLKVHHDTQSTGHAILDRGQELHSEGLQDISMKIYSLTEEVERLTVQVGAGFNATIGDLATELYVLKGRQAASAALQVIQFLLFAGYLVALAVNYVVKKCRKHSKKRGEKRGEEKVELLEQRLQERKSRRRAAAARQSSADK